MKHLAQSMFSQEIRRPYLDRYKRQLKDVLRGPLSDGERTRVQQSLQMAGKPKDYLNPVVLPGSIELVNPSPNVPNLEKEDLTPILLASLSYNQLQLYARTQNIEVQPGDTKAQIISMILAQLQ